VSTLRSFSRFRDDDGAAAVEFTLLLVPFLVLCFGLISGGIVLNDKMSLTQGVREAARYGATFPYTPSGSPPGAGETTFLTTIRSTAQGDSYGQIGTDAATYCVGLRRASDSSNYRLDNNETNAVAGTCPGAPVLSPGYLVVIAYKPASFDFIVDRLTLNLRSLSVARYEGTS
jgi:Flp pilus assembly pilin Flp